MDNIFFVSDHCRKIYLHEYPCIKKKALVNYNGVDYKRFSSGKALSGIPSRKAETILLCVTNFNYPEKSEGVEILLDAFRLLLRKEKKIRLFILGGGDSLARIREQAEDIKDAVVFTGFVRNVPDYMKLADIFVYSSLYDSFGMSVLEAEAVGLPVVVTDVQGIPETMLAGKTGFLTKPRPKELASAIHGLIKDPEKRTAFGNAARDFAKCMSWEANAKRYIAVWSDGL